MSNTETKSRTQRVAFSGGAADFSITFTLPGGDTQVIKDHRDLPGETITHALQYGIRRLYQDGLSGSIRNGEEADDAAQALIEKFISGDWTTSRASGPKAPTMESVATTIVKAKYPKAKADEVKAKVATLLDEEADPARFAIVKKAFAKAKAEWEERQGVADDIDI